jgi:RNA polymerase sigma-70 factor, ECF subfamily
MESEWSGRLHQALERLTPDHRVCLLLLHEERSYQEIGALLNCPVGTVRSCVHRARISLRQALQAEAA